MRRERVPRRLVVCETVWLWSVAHAHTAVRDAEGRHVHPDCRELLTLRRADDRHAQLRLVFRSGDGRFASDGTGADGSVGTRDRDLNLHEPGAVRRLLDEAAARDLLPDAHGVTERDGWPLFDAVAPDPSSP